MANMIPNSIGCFGHFEKYRYIRIITKMNIDIYIKLITAMNIDRDLIE